MFYKTQRSWDMNTSELKSSDITPKHVFDNRRQFIARAGKNSIGLGLGLGLGLGTGLGFGSFTGSAQAAIALTGRPNMAHTLQSLDEPELTAYDAATSYNNFYEFGTGKSDPVENAVDFQPTPWTVVVDGAVANPGTYDFNDLIRPHQLEERVYRFRCVEAWSMVVPWLGVSLGDIIARLEPHSNARYIAFQTLHDPERMPGQKGFGLDWPYVEGLRMDEAMNPLA
jgi:sulfoxide reductase catalytic subunit YedY